ncbi:nucleoporin nup44 protein [Rutstroemia sp. NJR-2017a BVV2]|nr:nucleoporin nup44 protein [Rutstroemia sp. NJR-2017a BVV2]PQE25195.1 nucleoporin nup44 protein [Rutstroemia sp. NJR-2017a BVV2]
MSSTFGQNKPAGGGLFGSTNTTSQPTGGLFGSTNTGNQNQQGGGLFGGALGQPTQQTQPQTGGLFGGLGSNNQQSQPQAGGLFGNNAGQNNQQPQQQTGGLFGGGLGSNNQQAQPQTGGLFGNTLGGQNNQQQQQQGGLFSGLGAQQGQQQQNNNLLGAPQQQNPLFGQSQQAQALGQTQQGNFNNLFNSGALVPREKSVTDQIATVLEKWDTGNPNCGFQHYFYNKVDEGLAPFYRPAPNEDPKAWEEALSKKPGPGYIPVLCVGFAQMGERIKVQQNNLATFNARLHDINASLTNLLQTHDTRTSIRAMDAKRKHVVLKQRCIALATKVQVLRNRGYALGGDEEDVKAKLMKLEKAANDPGLGARAEEIWARMINVQERGRLLRSELEKAGQESGEILDDVMNQRAKKILEDYQTQLGFLKKELDKIQKDYVEWEKEQPQQAAKTNGR